jgi:hypothetical protein
MDQFTNLLLIAIFTSLPFLIAFIAAVLIGVIAFFQLTDCRTAFWTISLSFLLEAMLSRPLGLGIGLNIFLPDVVFIAIAIAAILRYMRKMQWNWFYALWIIFGAALFFSFTVGIINYGSKAGVEFRQYFYIWAGVFYLSGFSLGERENRSLMRVLIFVAIGLMALALYRWTAAFHGFADYAWQDETGPSRFRVLNSAHTLVISQVMVLMFYYATASRQLEKWVLPFLVLLFLCIVVLQHRTVWIVTIIELVVLSIIDHRVRVKFTRYISILIVSGLFLIVALLLTPEIRETLYYATFIEPFSEKSTLSWRTESWQIALGEWFSEGPKTWFLGFPFGKGFLRYLTSTHSYVDTYPHNYYITTLMRVGLVGLSALLLTLFIGVRIAIRNRTVIESSNGMMLGSAAALVLISQFVFFISYNPGYFQALFIGVAFSIVRQLENKERDTADARQLLVYQSPRITGRFLK